MFEELACEKISLNEEIPSCELDVQGRAVKKLMKECVKLWRAGDL